MTMALILPTETGFSPQQLKLRVKMGMQRCSPLDGVGRGIPVFTLNLSCYGENEVPVWASTYFPDRLYRRWP